jgi:hypothetical protein
MIAFASDALTTNMTNPIEVPPDKDWRVMGLWTSGQEFLLTLAESAADCLGRVRTAIDDFSREELDQVESIWIEQWTRDEFFGEYRWLPTEEIPLRRYRLRVAAKEQHAGRRTA